MTEFWQQCINHLSKGLPPAQVKQWIMPLSPIGFNEDETEFHISAPSVLKQNWAMRYYAPEIQKLIKENFNHDVKVVVLINKAGATPVVATPSASPAVTTALPTTPEAPSITPTTAAVPKVETSMVGNIEVTIEEDDTITTQTPTDIVPPSHTAKAAKVPGIEDNEIFISQGVLIVPETKREAYAATNLNPAHTFANLVVGHSNELAYATAKNVIRNLGKVGYNPLFLYASTGLGKTHLMHAIGNELFRTGRIKSARYIHANDYYTEIAQKMRKGEYLDYRMQEMKEYANLDLLLIDDIQFFKNKERTQQEFFHLYDTMVRKGKQVVISSDTYPQELADIDERLISRFSSGLPIQIEPPELEMRVAILMKKAESKPNIVLTDEAAFFIAKHIRSNIRELEGGLQKVMAFAEFKSFKEITVDVCKEALKDLLRVVNGLITVENIQKTVADFYKMKVSDIYSKSRKAENVRLRHIAMYLAKELTRKSLPELGEAFGGRDHSTVHHAVEKIIELRATDSKLNHELHVLKQTLKG
ncbi:chromosomal replication initiator protein DnaA [Pelistega europaea]|uniref:Chromosomal replication initiator protein DnaA n=1 Tax=Pelistega europaea TaxID=106147 RepID=A0A7Y4P3K2_9BURK|nr:chromosomal replication initiator protein DnaA [Pelistega europaea]NOL48541.1 chromosomal replication initiator protein DnaA [Pelistega europaea]